MKWHEQFVRYVLVGLVSNTIGYVLYLLLTRSIMGPKSAMSLLYAVGVLQTFIFNRNWSFGYSGQMSSSFLRYVSTYALGYVVNLSALLVLVDIMGLSHEWVQACLVLSLAAGLFLLQRYWVFRATPSANEQRA